MQSTDRLLLPREVQDICRISNATLYRLLEAGRFPRPIRLGSRSTRWKQSELLEWLEGQRDTRPAAGK